MLAMQLNFNWNKLTTKTWLASRAYVALFVHIGSRIMHYAIAHTDNAANTHTQGSNRVCWSQEFTPSSKADYNHITPLFAKNEPNFEGATWVEEVLKLWEGRLVNSNSENVIHDMVSHH